MANRLKVLAVIVALLLASVLFVAARSAPSASVGPRGPSATLEASASTPAIWYNYSDFFNVPYGEWWDLRSPIYGDEPIGASCFNQTSVNDGTCVTNVAGLPRVASYPYENWYPSALGSTLTDIYAPYRVHAYGLSIPGYNLSQPVFLPVLNYGAQPGATLSWRWYMQYLDKANYTLLTSTRACYASSAALANDGYQLWNKISITLDNQEAARLFGAPVNANPATIQNWWNTNTKPGCSGKPAQSGALESAVDAWFANEANGKYEIYNGYAGAYTSLYTNITATVVTGGGTGLTNVYLEHGAWGTESLLSRWFYWGNASYAGNQLNSGKAAGWWSMENGWWEDVNYGGQLTAAAMNFNLTGVLQYHFQERAIPGPDGVYRSSTNSGDTDDVPVWTWGPQLLDYVTATNPHPYSEIARYNGLNYIKNTPGSTDYGTNTSFDYVPLSWAAKAGEWWNFVFPTSSAAYYQNPATAVFGTTLPNSQLPSITSTLSFLNIFPSTYGTWTAATGTWSVTGGTAESWPPSTGPGTYPYLPYPGIFFHPATIPPTVDTSAASGISTTAATLNGDLTSLGTASPVTVGFLWGTSPTLAGAANVTVGSRTAVGAFSTGLSGLSPTTTYYLEAWANGAGFARGSILSFTTAGTPPSVTTNAATGITTSAAALNGATTSLGTAASVTVGFLWGTSASLIGAANVTAGTQSAAGAFTSSLTGLASGTTYYFQAWALGAGFAQGSILSFTTQTSATAPSVSSLAASAITTTAANLNGDLTGLGTAASVTVGFLWGTDPTLGTATNVTVGPETAIGTFTSPLAGLSPGTTYYFQAWANGNGFSFGVILSFTTASTPPSVVTDAASGITVSGATLNGHTTSLGTATTVTVGFLWGTSASLAGATNDTVGTQGPAAAFVDALTGLASGTAYYFQAWANGQGFAAGSILSFMTAVAPPVVATNGASGITSSAAALNGAASSLGTAATVTVGFLWGASPTLAGATNVTAGTLTAPGSFSASLTSLTPSTTYYFEAWANGDGFANGSILSFTTLAVILTPPSVTTSAASGITATGATLNGDLTALGTAASVEVGFLWSTDSTLSIAFNVSAGTQTAVGAFSSALTGLTPGTTYYFRAWAHGAGFATGSILSFATSLAAPVVTTAAATGITTVNATLNGVLNGMGSAGTVQVGFLFGTDPTLAAPGNMSVAILTAAGPYSNYLGSLSPSTTYYFQAWASGDGFVKGAILSFTTPAAKLWPTVTTVAASSVNATGATLNGNLMSLGSASTVTVGFLWGTSPTLAGATNVTVGTRSATWLFSKVLSGLAPNTAYYFQAWAIGDGFVKGTIQNFTTSPAVTPPSEPTFLGMPAMIGYAVVAVILAVVALLVVLVLMRRRKKAPPEAPPESPPENPPGAP